MSSEDFVPARIEGRNLVLRLIEPEDASYVFALRSNANYNTYLSEVRGTVEDQRKWIENYKRRETTLRELYYVIERRDGVRCGLVRIYDIREDSFTWGSWILDENKTPKAALESAILVYDIGFTSLGLSTSVFDVRRDNLGTLAFHRRWGAVETGADDQDVFFSYSRTAFLVDRDKRLSVIAGVVG